MEYTAEYIQENPDVVQTMSHRDVEQFIASHKGKRGIVDIRRAVQQRQRDLIAEDKLIKSIKAGKERILRKIKKIEWFLAFPDLADYVSDMGRTISNEIHDGPKIWTGYQSENSILEGEAVDEHFYPRQHAGEFLVEEKLRLGDKFTTLYLVENLYKFCQVHKVTKGENQDLTVPQTKENFHDWTISYGIAVSELTRICDKPRLYDYVFQEIINDLKNGNF